MVGVTDEYLTKFLFIKLIDTSNGDIILSTLSIITYTSVIPIIWQWYIIILYACNLPMLTTHDHHVFVAVIKYKIINFTIKYVRSYIITHYLIMDTALILQSTPCRKLYVYKQLITSLILFQLLLILNCYPEQKLTTDVKMMYTYVTWLPSLVISD